MIHKSTWSGLLTALFAVLAGLMIPAQARGDFILQVQEDSGPIQTFTTVTGSPMGSLTVPTISTASFTLLSANVIGATSPTDSLEQQVSLFIVNTSTSTRTLRIMTSVQNYTTPTSPPPLYVFDTVSGSLVSGTLSNGLFRGSADSSNALITLGTQVGDFNGSGLDLSFSASGISQSFAASGSRYGFSPNSAPYSLSTYLEFQLSGGGSLTVTGGNVQTLHPTPLPSSLALILTSLPGGIGVIWCMRRKWPGSTFRR